MALTADGEALARDLRRRFAQLANLESARRATLDAIDRAPPDHLPSLRQRLLQIDEAIAALEDSLGPLRLLAELV